MRREVTMTDGCHGDYEARRGTVRIAKREQFGTKVVASLGHVCSEDVLCTDRGGDIVLGDLSHRT